MEWGGSQGGELAEEGVEQRLRLYSEFRRTLSQFRALSSPLLLSALPLAMPCSLVVEPQSLNDFKQWFRVVDVFVFRSQSV